MFYLLFLFIIQESGCAAGKDVQFSCSMEQLQVSTVMKRKGKARPGYLNELYEMFVCSDIELHKKFAFNFKIVTVLVQ